MSVLADPFDVRRALGGRGLLRAFNDAGVLAAADVHVALRLAELAGEPAEEVRLALALAVRAPRHGHVFVDLATVRDTAAVETDEPVDLGALPWPAASTWAHAVAPSQLTAVGEDDPASDQPLRLIGDRLYLDRYWRAERSVAAELNELARSERLEVIVGGPGTGKTTTAARLVARLIAQSERPPLVALAAPTGKAAARLEEAVHAEIAEAARPQTRELLARLRASTLHRLLGSRPDSRSRFTHDRGNRLPHDVVIVDETSMVSLWMMARLLEAVRPGARLILVGDPGQLSSIEAGVVLGDIVAAAPDPRAQKASGIVVLDRVHRYGGGIARLAEAIRAGDADATVAALSGGSEDVRWLAEDPLETDLGPVQTRATAAGRAVIAAARAGDPARALEALGSFRVLCAHRRGPYGVSHWTSSIEGWLGEEIEDAGQRDYVGRPLLVTENDYELGLYNGDTGVIVQSADGPPSAAFERGGRPIQFSPLRLSAVETVYAMTIHKSQGSQFDVASVLLPEEESRILTRELLYTAVTRARQELILVGTEATVRRAVGRPVARASGLRDRLTWTIG